MSLHFFVALGILQKWRDPTCQGYLIPNFPKNALGCWAWGVKFFCLLNGAHETCGFHKPIEGSGNSYVFWGRWILLKPGISTKNICQASHHEGPLSQSTWYRWFHGWEIHERAFWGDSLNQNHHFGVTNHQPAGLVAMKSCPSWSIPFHPRRPKNSFKVDPATIVING